MEQGEQGAWRATVVREARRSQQRTAVLHTALAEPGLQRYLAEVDRRWPGLADTERVRVARLLAAAMLGATT